MGSPEEGEGILETSEEVHEASFDSAAGESRMLPGVEEVKTNSCNATEGGLSWGIKEGVLPVSDTTILAPSCEPFTDEQGADPTLESTEECV